MVLASGSRVTLAYQKETTRNTNPATPGTSYLRTTGRAINLQKNLLESEEVRTSGQVAVSRHGFNRVVGQPGFELSVGAYDDMIASAARNTWAQVTTTAVDMDVASQVITRGTGSFITDGFKKGDWVELVDFTHTTNTAVGYVLLSNVTATTVTVVTTLADETNSDNQQVIRLINNGYRVTTGNTLETFVMERRFEDIGRYQRFNGVAVNELALNIQPEAIIGGSISLLGMSAAAMSQTSFHATPTAAAANEPLAAFDGALYAGNQLVAVVTGLNFTIANNRETTAVVGSKFSPDIFEGTQRITGQLTALFEDETFYNNFVNEVEVPLSLIMNDINGTDALAISAPRVKYNGADMDPPQQGPVPIQIPIAMLEDSTLGYALAFYRTNA